MKEISLLPLLLPVQTGVLQRSNNGLAAGTRYHAVVNAVCAVGRAEPGIPTQVVGRALDGGCNATGRERSNHLSHGIAAWCRNHGGRGRGGLTRCGCGCAGVVGGGWMVSGSVGCCAIWGRVICTCSVSPRSGPSINVRMRRPFSVFTRSF